MKKKKLNLKIEHQVPGRIRMKVYAAKGNPELLEEIKQTFSLIPGIEEITVNPVTGSVVLHYDEEHHDRFHEHIAPHLPHSPPKGELDELAEKIEQEAEFLAEHSELARNIVDFLKELDHAVKASTNNTIDLKILFAAGIIGFTLIGVGANAATPVWVTLVMFSINHFIEMHPPVSTTTREARGA